MSEDLTNTDEFPPIRPVNSKRKIKSTSGEPPLPKANFAASKIDDTGEIDPVPAGATNTTDNRRMGWVSKVSIAVICALLGFFVTAQIRIMNESPYRNMRDDELLRILDEQNVKFDELTKQKDALSRQYELLKSSADEDILRTLEKQINDQKIILGLIPASGPGIEIELKAEFSMLSAENMFNLITELRNSGAEAIEVNEIRIIGTSFFETKNDALFVDDSMISSPFIIRAIGDANSLKKGLEIQAGFVDIVKNNGVEVNITEKETLQISATRNEPKFKYAKTQD